MAQGADVETSQEPQEPNEAVEPNTRNEPAAEAEPTPEPAAEAPTEDQPEAQEVEAEQRTLPVALPELDQRLALLEGIVYAADEPVTLDQLVEGLELPRDVLEADLARLIEDARKDHRGVEIRKVAGGYKMFTKAEHHEAVRKFVKTMRPKLKLSLPALETLAVIAYKQPVTVPEIQAVRGVNASGVIHTLLKHKLIANAGRKKVVGKPMMYKTTREFLVQFGLDDLAELPNLKELEELSRAAFGEDEAEVEESVQSPPDESSVDEAVAAAEEEAERTAAEAEEASEC
ncbi:MAG: SMC-Scp complex subunit ScpB [Acidobacteria bacterium]|nr:SMC-Scp complex subunit ScpB [Acidobacteriota bacterium]